MIDVNTRDPARTFDDLHQLVNQAISAGLVPLEWWLGFFIARDIHAFSIRDWPQRRTRKGEWLAIRQIFGLPASVVELEDRIQLIAAPSDGRGFVQLTKKRIFTCDRRATGD